MENFIDIVHRSLDGPDPPRGVQCIYHHELRLWGLLAPKPKRALRSWDVVASWLSRPGLASGSSDSVMVLDPSQGFGAGGLRGLGPGSLLISCSWCWRGPGCLAISTMLMASVVTMM
jgi:hypothetical protein